MRPEVCFEPKLTLACWQRIVTDQNQDGEGLG